MFSARATLLMDNLETLSSQLGSHIDAIAELLEPVPTRRKKTVKRHIDAITGLRGQFKSLQVKIAEGPDAEFDTRAMRGRTASVPWTTLDTRSKVMSRHFDKWPRVHEWIFYALKHKPETLYPDTPPENTVRGAQEDASDLIFKLVHSFVNPGARENEPEDQGGYADVGLAHTHFVKHMHAAYRLTLAQRLGRPARFLDVGCGGGLTVLSATPFFDPAEGFDFVAAYVEEAKKLMALTHQTHGKVFQADGLTFEAYGDYDVIYFYCPLRIPDLQHQLEDRIASQARNGALLIAPHTEFNHRRCGCAHIAGRIYLAKGSEEDAARLRETAERIGACVAPPPAEFQSPWAPILQSLRMNGFHGPTPL